MLVKVPVIAKPEKFELSPLETEAWSLAENEAQARAAAEAARERAEAAFAEAEAARVQAVAEIGRLRKELDTVSREYEKMLNSTSWRATSPLRKFLLATPAPVRAACQRSISATRGLLNGRSWRKGV
jgi:hypothetical protein